MSKTAIVLGGTGMLGSAVVRALLKAGIEVTATARNVEDAERAVQANFVSFDVEKDQLQTLLSPFPKGSFVVNCIGIIKPHINDDSDFQRERAIVVNALFPCELAKQAEIMGMHVIQIATDCVYDGIGSFYVESDPSNATDVYGKTKSLGEVPNRNFLNLRCSVIGPELKARTSFLEWVLSHPAGSSIPGFTDHRWNGITAQAFGRIAAGIVHNNNRAFGTFHVVPDDFVTKEELARIILSVYKVSGVELISTLSGKPVDRTLSTRHPEFNDRLWRDAGYATIPTVAQMVEDLIAENSSDGEHV